MVVHETYQSRCRCNALGGGGACFVPADKGAIALDK